MSLRQIEKETGIPRKKISKLLKSEGCEIKARSTGTTGKRKYQLDENVFETIDTEAKAYWLGFLYADGHVDDGKVELCLAAKDKEQVEKFRSFIGSDAPINKKMVKEHEAYRFTACSKKMMEDLHRNGCTAAKSLTLDFPILRDDLIHHFIRGYFDGDGSFMVRKDGQPIWSLVGTKNLLKYCQDIFVKLGLNRTKIDHGNCGQAWQMRYSGTNNYKTIADYLYKDATVYMDRKTLLPS